jgi:RimJ/RimL family protein N-acetyltransferase
VRIVADERCARFVSAALGFGLCPPYTTMGLERDGAIVGAVLFNHFEGADVHVTLAGHGWTRGFLRAVGDYVFDQLGCERMTAVTRCPQVARFAERLGGRREGVLRSHFGPGHDAMVLGILREEYLRGTLAANPRRD